MSSKTQSAFVMQDSDASSEDDDYIQDDHCSSSKEESSDASDDGAQKSTNVLREPALNDPGKIRPELAKPGEVCERLPTGVFPPLDGTTRTLNARIFLRSFTMAMPEAFPSIESFQLFTIIGFMRECTETARKRNSTHESFDHRVVFHPDRKLSKPGMLRLDVDLLDDQTFPEMSPGSKVHITALPYLLDRRGPYGHIEPAYFNLEWEATVQRATYGGESFSAMARNPSKYRLSLSPFGISIECIVSTPVYDVSTLSLIRHVQGFSAASNFGPWSEGEAFSLRRALTGRYFSSIQEHDAYTLNLSDDYLYGKVNLPDDSKWPLADTINHLSKPVQLALERHSDISPGPS